MLALFAVTFVIGAVLAMRVPVRQFAAGILILGAACFALAIFIGVPSLRAFGIAFGAFVCGQFGYVAGIALRALFDAKFRPAKARNEAGRVHDEGYGSSGKKALKGGHEPLPH